MFVIFAIKITWFGITCEIHLYMCLLGEFAKILNTKSRPILIVSYSVLWVERLDWVKGEERRLLEQGACLLTPDRLTSCPRTLLITQTFPPLSYFCHIVDLIKKKTNRVVEMVFFLITLKMICSLAVCKSPDQWLYESFEAHLLSLSCSFFFQTVLQCEKSRKEQMWVPHPWLAVKQQEKDISISTTIIRKSLMRGNQVRTLLL